MPKSEKETNLFLQIMEKQDPKMVGQFITQPLVAITEMVTGAISEGKIENKLMTGRLVQSVVKGNLYTQAGREIKRLQEKGRIPEDYADKKYGFQSFADLLKIIDDGDIDEDKLQAVLAMFALLNEKSRPESEALLRYKLFKITTELSSSQLVTLKAIYDMPNRKNSSSVPGAANVWLKEVATRLGHDLDALVEEDEEILMAKKILTVRQHSDRSGIDIKRNRLSTLGLKLCEFLFIKRAETD